ncbi:hypothetical protein PTTG_08143 [Puccinia triticina 1-1 BBBD Race 1]|uniref:Uncharacterized protein n=1 Tax=Puccinia triticina (isolate 1-1 / race 1 (BBBD)) TaxID=630390 RepID=A0A0C4F4V3_PUCT1|nr:hypothetical protein PTTG_08143 [Puccinia triticina 1-1 BBBD Race 1]
MSCLGIDLFNRDNPPPGYHSASELWRIHGGPKPAELTPQMIDCSTSFRLFYPKSKLSNKGWSTVESKKKFLILVPDSSSLEEFQDSVAQECNKKFDGAADLIWSAIKNGFPKTEWKISMNLPPADEFKTIADYRITDVPSFTHWMATVIANGKDHTKASLAVLMVNRKTAAKQAKAVIKVKKHILTQDAAQTASSLHANPSIIITPGDFDAMNIYVNQIFNAHPPNPKYEQKMPVYIDPTDPSQYSPLTLAIVQRAGWSLDLRPPPNLKFENLSAAKKRKLNQGTTSQINSPAADSDSSLVVDLKVNLLNQYLKFVKIPVCERDMIIGILTAKEATNPKIFRSNNITREMMKDWGLEDIYIAQLRDHVNKFEKSRASH